MRRRIDLDIHDPVLDHRGVGLDGHDTGRLHDLARADVEHPLVEGALDVITVDEALGQRPGAV